MGGPAEWPLQTIPDTFPPCIDLQPQWPPLCLLKITHPNHEYKHEVAIFIYDLQVILALPKSLEQISSAFFDAQELPHFRQIHFDPS